MGYNLHIGSSSNYNMLKGTWHSLKEMYRRVHENIHRECVLKVTGPKITHLRVETEFWEGKAS